MLQCLLQHAQLQWESHRPATSAHFQIKYLLFLLFSKIKEYWTSLVLLLLWCVHMHKDHKNTHCSNFKEWMLIHFQSLLSASWFHYHNKVQLNTDWEQHYPQRVKFCSCASRPTAETHSDLPINCLVRTELGVGKHPSNMSSEHTHRMVLTSPLPSMPISQHTMLFFHHHTYTPPTALTF